MYEFLNRRSNVNTKDKTEDNTKEHTKNTKPKYNALGAVEDYKEFKPYLEMLRDAIKKGCTNIAITGPYGCGKSSVFKTFEANQWKLFKFKTKKIIHVSLATFDGKNTGDGYNLEVEKSILQQLFYKVKSHKIPFSRFNKISNISFIKTWLQVVALFATILLGMIIFKPNWIANILYNYKVYNIMVSKFASITLYIIFMLLLLSLLTCFIRFLFKKIRISKFNIKSAEFVINDEDKSIFNKYIDEIIYFFEVTKYKIVIIEDLDRFENTNIFIKLRELNYLINTSDHVKQTVSFVYAVGDSIFDDYERTKFFDFIIPVIPFVNSTNSGEKLYEIIKNKKLEEELPKEYIYKVSIYIDDMRVLKNTVNEYLLYKSKIDIDYGDYIPLFSLMLYKNLYPSDFELIDKNDGVLFNAFKNKTNKIDIAIEKKEIELNKKLFKKERLDDELLDDLDELKISLMNRLIKYKPGYYRIRIDNSVYSLSSINGFSNFDLETLNNFKSLSYLNNNNQVIETINFEKFNNKFKHNSISYYDRYLFIKDGKKNYKVKLLEEITKIEKDIENLAETSIQDYINNFGLLDTNISDLLLFMFREGYIKENYYDYISNFYNGRLTKADVEFILSVQNRKAKEFTYSLNKVNEIIERLEAKYFKNEETLNFDLLSFLIENSGNYNEKLNNLVNQFIELDNEKAEFIKRYIYSNYYSEEFIRLVCKKSRGIWGYYFIKEAYWLQDKKKLLISIILNVEVEDIVEINKCSIKYDGISARNALKHYIAFYDSFIELFNKQEIDKVSRVIKELDVKFASIKRENKDTKLFDYIVENNLYEINEYMISLVMGKYEKSYDGSYTCILNSNISSLIEYIKKNIGLYLYNVYFDDYKDVKEKEDSIVRLLKLDVEDIQKQKIIKEVNFIPTRITEYELSLWGLLLSKNELEFLWENIFNYYEKFGLDDNLVNYLNKILVNKEIDKINIKGKEPTYHNFIEKVLCNYEVKDNILGKLLDDSLEYAKFDIAEADKDKVNILIDKKIIILNLDNFNHIYGFFNECLIRFIEVNIEKFVEKVEEYGVDNKIINDLMLSSNISDHNKLKILKYVNENIEYTCDKIKCAEAILDLVINYKPKFKLNTGLRESLIEMNNTTEKKIKFLNSQFNYLEKNEKHEVLNSAGGEYARITTFTSKPIILINNKENLLLAENLKNRRMISSYSKKEKGIRLNTFRK